MCLIFGAKAAAQVSTYILELLIATYIMCFRCPAVLQHQPSALVLHPRTRISEAVKMNFRMLYCIKIVYIYKYFYYNQFVT